MIKNCYEAVHFYVEREEYLDFSETKTDRLSEWEFSPDFYESKENLSTRLSQNIPMSKAAKKEKENISLDTKRKVMEFWESGKNKNRQLETVSRRFRFVKTIDQLCKFGHQFLFRQNHFLPHQIRLG